MILNIPTQMIRTIPQMIRTIPMQMILIIPTQMIPIPPAKVFAFFLSHDLSQLEVGEKDSEPYHGTSSRSLDHSDSQHGA